MISKYGCTPGPIILVYLDRESTRLTECLDSLLEEWTPGMFDRAYSRCQPGSGS